jgi:predicted nuclease with TOPRIM domain
MSDPRLLFVASALTLLAFAASATAVETAKPAASQAKGRYATREQLRECLDRQAELKARFRGIEAANAARAEAVKRLEAEGVKLREMKAQIDRDNVAAVQAFKQQLTDYNTHAAALNKESDDSSAAADAYNADSESVNQACTALPYHTQDMDAVLKERKKAASAAAP